VDHLGRDGHELGRLGDPHTVAVDRRQNGAERPARDAAVVQRKVFEAVVGSGAVGAARPRRCDRFADLGQRGQPPVGWIDHEGGVAERAHTVLVHQQRFPVRRHVAGALILTRSSQEFLRRQRLAQAGALGTGHRHAAHVVGAVHALEAGVTPRGARHSPVRVERRRRQGLRGPRAQLGRLARVGLGRENRRLRGGVARDDGESHENP
jgi:hypothetical protein